MDTIAGKAKALVIGLTGSPTKRAHSSVQQVLDERMILSEAIEAASAIVKRYPNGGRNAGDGYIGALASTLMSYPRQIALRCADFPNVPGKPLEGICGICEFLPTPAVLIAWCEKQTEPLRGTLERDKRIAEQFALRDESAPQFGRLTYDELKAKYGDGEGGWGIDTAPRPNAYRWPSVGELEAICGEDTWQKIPLRK